MHTKRWIAAGLGALLVAFLAWFGLEGTPPNMELAGLPGPIPVAGPLRLEITAFDDRSGLSEVRASVDGVEVAVEEGEGRLYRLVVDTGTLSDGSHRLEVEAVDRSLWRNQRRLGVSFRSDNTAPGIELARSSASAGQGLTLAVLARIDEPVVEARVRLLGQDVAMEALGDGLWRALFGIAVEEEPGDRRIELSATDEAGNRRQVEADLSISATAFEQGGFIQLTGEQTAARQDRSAADESNDKRSRAYETEVRETRWAGTFARPAPGRRTSPFGKYRTYSDGRTKHHKGTDIAAPSGTAVKAPAGGVVTLAEELHIYGNAVIVKHGPRVSSSYNHLSAIRVAVGDVVEAGDVVGEVGSTGQSTGPHLHWGMVVGGVAVDPEQWTLCDFDAPLPGDFDQE